MTRKLIHVTQEDIDNGKPQNGHECPIALAADRKFRDADPHPHNACVGTERINITVALGERRYAIPLPPRARQFIQDFDEHKPVVPIKFYINLDDSEK